MGSNGGRLCELCDPEVRLCFGGKNDFEQLVAETTLLLGFGTQGRIVFLYSLRDIKQLVAETTLLLGCGTQGRIVFSYPLCDIRLLVARTTWSS